MKRLFNYVFDDNINEAQRGRPRKETPADANPERTVGKDAETNGSGGKWGIEEPYDNEAVTPLSKEEKTKNVKELIFRMKTKRPFFILGEAGWGKTSIITDIAKRFGRHVITVYLDKCEATDLGGIPVPREDSRGNVYQDTAMPGWASYMLDHPDQKFLLFFDEMNQAAPDVQNALMPIVLKNDVCGKHFDNFIVGAAGNYAHENDAVSDLSGPLKSRFKPIIIWSTGGAEDWKSAFGFLHKKWDAKLGPEIIQKFEAKADLFPNPREIDDAILKPLYESLQGEGEYADFDVEDFDSEFFLGWLESLAKEDLTRTQETDLKQLAEYMHRFVRKMELDDSPRGRGGKDVDMIPENMKKQVKMAITRGYLTNDDPSDKRKYGVSRENIADIFCDDEYNPDALLNREMLERLIRKLEADGVEFKFEKNADFLKAGYSDPSEE